MSEELKRRIRTVIYGRFSSDMQREESIDAQVRACKEWAEKEGVEIVGVYTDEAMTAKNDNRDDFQRMVEDAYADKFDMILVHKFNRFARNKFDSAIYKKRLRDIGIRVVSATQKIEDNPEGRLMESVIEAMDEYYSDNLGLEVTKGLKENAYKGKTTGGMAPIGFYYDDEGKLREDETTSYIVRTIYSMYLEGFSMEGIANYLNVKGYRGTRGKEFAAKSIKTILTNERYTGTYLYTIGNEEFRTENNHDVIIDRMTFHRVQEMRKKRSHKPRIKSKHLYSLTGKITCGVCGGKYCGSGAKGYRNVKGVKKDIVYYVCPNKRYKRCNNTNVNRDKLEKHICEHILNVLLTDESIQRIADDFEKVLNEYKDSRTDKTIGKLESEKTKLEAQQEKLLDLYLDPESDLDKETYNKRSEAIKNRLFGIEKEIKAYYINERFAMGRDDAIEYLEGFRKKYDANDKYVVKALIETFVEEVLVNHRDIDITYKVDFNQKIHDKNGDRDELAKDGDIVTSFLPLVIISPQYFKETVSKQAIKKTKY